MVVYLDTASTCLEIRSVPVDFIEEVWSMDPAKGAVSLAHCSASTIGELHVAPIFTQTSFRVKARREVLYEEERHSRHSFCLESLHQRRCYLCQQSHHREGCPNLLDTGRCYDLNVGMSTGCGSPIAVSVINLPPVADGERNDGLPTTIWCLGWKAVMLSSVAQS